MGKNVWRIEDIFFYLCKMLDPYGGEADQRRIFDTFQWSFVGDTIGYSQFPLGVFTMNILP